MAFYDRRFASASPVLTLSPQPSHQTHMGVSGLGFAPSRHDFISATTTSNGLPLLPDTSRFAGQKRSRDEAAIDTQPEASSELSQPESEELWVYGPGMTLIKPDSPYVADASTQSGTWLEEGDVLIDKNKAQNREMLHMRSHKTQRVEQIGSIGLPTLALGQGTSGGATAQAPVIDNVTLHLGIGWRKLSDDEHIQAAARGWARFIENHYPLSNVSIRLETKALQSYLVEASEGFFLFAEDLRRGRLVSRTTDGVLRNLQCVPPLFDSNDELLAAVSSNLPDGDDSMEMGGFHLPNTSFQ